MRVWVDLSNSPHVALFVPIVDHLESRGDEVFLTARDHAQTVALARRRWPGVLVVGGASPPGVGAKAASIVRRSAALARVAGGRRIDLALSHGSYAQLAAARMLGIPALTMMDYEYQPANHASFRLARRVLVPAAFPGEALRRTGGARKALRYPGYKEELYLAGLRPDPGVLARLGLDHGDVVAVLRPPPSEALYHRHGNGRFEEVARRVASAPGVRAVLITRAGPPARWRQLLPDAVVPESAVDGLSLLAAADLTIGAGGTMTRESALLGTPTYTVFAARLAAVDAALIREGRVVDLREPGIEPLLAKKGASPAAVPTSRRDEILACLDRGLAEVSAGRRRAVLGRERLRRPRPAERRG